MRYQIINDSFYFNRYQCVDGEETKNGIVTAEGHFIQKSDYITLNEELTSQDERKIRDMIRDQLELFFWRLYTKKSFLLK